MKVNRLHFSYGDKRILHNVNILFPSQKITTILGSNGCGKSTLLKLCTKELHSRLGRITLDGQDINEINNKDFSKKVAIVHQKNRLMANMTVRELVAFGRNPYISFMKSATKEDEEAIDQALELCNLQDLSHRSIKEMSGGQSQRAWIALAVAQKTQFLFLDEPTTYLDIKYQVEILDLVRFLNEKLKTTIIMVLHDINQSLEYSHEVIGLYKGRVEFQGPPDQALNEERISKLYGIDLQTVKIDDKMMVLSKRRKM